MTSQAKAPRIAVIDDDAVFVDLMHDLLAIGEGYEVVTTQNWLDSFEFVKTSRPDLIILDLMLGREQSGWQILNLIREDESLTQIPVILCSAAEPALRNSSGAATGHAPVETLAKPFDVDDLLGTIERLLA